MESHLSLYLTYSDVFGKPASKQALIKEIQKIDIYEALNILSQLTALSDGDREILSNNFTKSMDKKVTNNYLAFENPTLHYTIKWFIAYGEESAPNIKLEVTKIEFSTVFHVLLITLMVADFMDDIDEVDSNLNLNKVFLKSFLREADTYAGTTVARQEAFFFDIFSTVQDKYPGEYPDIHLSFKNKYNYSIVDYSNFLYGIATPALNRNLEELENTASYHIDPFPYLRNHMNQKKITQLINDLSIDPLLLKHWALDSIENHYDMDPLLRYPFFKKGNMLFPISIVYLNYAGFDGLFFKIKDSMSDKDSKRLFSLFGRLFEEYIEKLILESATLSKIPYKVTPEFTYKYKKQNIKSSDLYVGIGKQILVIECKSRRILRNTKVLAEEASTISDFDAVVIKPIKQAASRMQQLKEINFFSNKLKPTILAVTYNGFPKVEGLHQPLRETSSDFVWDYFSITEIENLASYIEHASPGKTIFKFINKKIQKEDYIPYSLIFFREIEKIRNKKGMKNTRPAFVNKMMVQGFSRLEQNLRMNQEIENGLK